MTICIGWIRGDTVFLIADSAVASSSPADFKRSLFGELHENSSAGSVQEAALKIFRWRSTAIAFAGNAETALSIFSHHVELAQSLEPLAAFETAWNSHGPFENNRVSALFAMHESGSPNLTLFNSDFPKLSSDCAVVGSLSNEERDEICATLSALPSYIEQPMSVLQVALAFFQSRSIFDNLMPQGIGGFYTGVAIGNSGLCWAAPTLHMIFRDGSERFAPTETPNGVIVYPKNDLVLVFNGRNQGWHAFMNSSGSNLKLSELQLAARARSSISNLRLSTLPLEYVTIYDLQYETATVLKISGFQPSPHAHLQLIKRGKLTSFVISCSTRLGECLNRKKDRGFLAYYDCTVP